MFRSLLTYPEAFRGPFGQIRSHVVTAAMFSALINLLYLAPTLYMMQVYDRVVPTGGVGTLLWLTLITGIALAVLAVLDAMRSHLMIRASMRLDRLLAPVVLDRSMQRGGPGSDTATMGIMRQFDAFRQALASPAVLAIFDLPWTPLYILVGFLIHPLLGMLLIGGGCVLLLLAWHNHRAMQAGSGAAQQATLGAYNIQEAIVREGELVRGLGMRTALVGRQVDERQAGFTATLGLQVSSARYNALVKFVRMFMQSVALGTGAWLAIKGEISVGAIIAASVLLSRALQPVEQLVGGFASISAARQALQSLKILLDTDDLAAETRIALPPPLGHLAVDRILVPSPDNSRYLLKQVSFELEAGQMLGIVGASGAGKTTLARALAGALAPTMGDIRLDGARLADWDPERLARHIGYLPQNNALLPGSVCDNIARFDQRDSGSRHLIDAEVIRVSRLTGVHDMILQLPNGYDTLVGPGSTHQLSAGQAQRVALARALYGNPRLLVLDEPNSALDAEGEEALNKVVAEARGAGATIIIVAHRAFALQGADQLLVLSDGAIKHFGPRQQVLEALGRGHRARNVVSMTERG